MAECVLMRIAIELEEALSVPTKATLEQLDLALRTVIYFCARYYCKLQWTLIDVIRGSRLMHCILR